MANRAKGQFSFTAADGESYTLEYDVNALCEIEDKFDAPIKDLQERLEQPSVRDLRVMLWAGLQKHHPEIDLKGAGALVLVQDAADALTQAMAAAMPKGGDSDDPRVPAAAGTG